MSDIIHIENRQHKALCGGHGEKAYSPLKATCEDCLAVFKRDYPEAWEDWKRSEANSE